jgi:aminoglycoside N3'-acetyltransferase
MEGNWSLVASFIALACLISGNPSWWIFCSKDAKAAWVTNGHDLLKSLSFWSLAGLLEEEEAMALLFGEWKQFLEKTWLGLINGN